MSGDEVLGILRGQGHKNVAAFVEACYADRVAQRSGGPTYDDLPPEMKEAIKDYLRFTNESLRKAVREYFEDTWSAERKWGKIGTWDVSRVTDMSKLFYRNNDDYWNDDIGAWDTSSVTNMRYMFGGYAPRGSIHWSITVDGEASSAAQVAKASTRTCAAGTRLR